MYTVKLVICDDEKRIRDIIAACVREVSDSIDIQCYDDAGEVISPAFDADIVFLDIQMPGIDGMKAAARLRENKKKTVIVFVTALEEYVYNAFDVGAFQYIVKPFDIDKLKGVIEKAISQAKEQRAVKKALADRSTDEKNLRTITVKCGRANRKVVLSDIVYAEIFDRRIMLHMKDRQKVEYYGRISDLESIAGDEFFRVHRAYLINLFYVKSYDSKCVHILDTQVPVARGRYQELVRATLTYNTRREGL